MKADLRTLDVFMLFGLLWLVVVAVILVTGKGSRVKGLIAPPTPAAAARQAYRRSVTLSSETDWDVIGHDRTAQAGIVATMQAAVDAQGEPWMIVAPTPDAWRYPGAAGDEIAICSVMPDGNGRFVAITFGGDLRRLEPRERPPWAILDVLPGD